MPGAWKRKMGDGLSAQAKPKSAATAARAWRRWWLRLKGHRILGRRVKTHAGEIDLVALRPFGPVCFVEVKARALARDAAEAVGAGAADSHCPRRLPISRQPPGAGPARAPALTLLRSPRLAAGISGMCGGR